MKSGWMNTQSREQKPLQSPPPRAIPEYRQFMTINPAALFGHRLNFPQSLSTKTKEVFTMSAVKRLIPGTFSKVPGGYARTIDERTTLFVPDMCASSFIPETGELYVYSPD